MKLSNTKLRSLLAFLLLFTVCQQALNYLTNLTAAYMKRHVRRSVIPGDSYYINLAKRNNSQSVQQPPIVSSGQVNQTKTKLILAYTTVYGKPFYPTRWGMRVSLKECDHSCEWSNRRSDYYKSDAVIFHLYNMGPEYIQHGYREFVIKDLPRRNSADQKWILMAREPGAFFYPQQLKLLNNMFNLTMTYQSDSDISIPYGKFWKMSPKDLKRKRKSAPANKNYLMGRTKMVAWMASNCVTSSRRETYVRELQKHIEVDVYGQCGPYKTEYVKLGDKYRTKLARKYKFYLAFENSDCDDYITEKFWNSLQVGIIPIVRGRRVDYKKVAPPNSYIHTDNFESPKQLADYLKKLALNPRSFHKYHQWRSFYDAEGRTMTPNERWLCQLCQQVHESPRKTVDIYEHFSEDTRCYTFNRERNRLLEHMEDIVHVKPINASNNVKHKNS